MRPTGRKNESHPAKSHRKPSDRSKPTDKRTTSASRPPILPAVKIKPAMGTELCSMWNEYLALPDWTPADRWLSNRMGGSAFSRLERLWISGMFLAGLRYGRFALFCDQKLNGGKRRTGSIKEQLKQIPAEQFYFWIEQRLLTDKQSVTPFRFRHELSSEAHTVVKAIFESVQKGSDRSAAIAFDGLSDWVVPFIDSRAARSGWNEAQKHRFIRRHSSTQPLWIRLTREPRRADLETELKSAGFTTVVKEGTAYAIRGDRNAVTLGSFKKGDIDIQDFASQQIGNAVIRRGATAVHIWDCCAGNGGKSVQIASALQNATVRVSDINDRKLVRIHERAAQQKLTKQIAYVPWDGSKLPDFHASIKAQGGFDIVLVDAPCSGSGTWRKNPDGRLFFEESRLSEITSIQKKLLHIVASAVKPGGSLIYGTCSFFVDENESQVDRFLAEHGNFRLEEMKLCGNPDVDSDTTFFAAMKRVR